MLIQFLLSLVLLIAFAMTWKRARQNAVTRNEAIFWSVIWIIAAVVIWEPDFSTKVAHFVGIGRGADLILYASVIALLIMVFQLHVAHDRLERKLTELVRQQALRDLERSNDQN